jgi:hypothetical protein
MTIPAAVLAPSVGAVQDGIHLGGVSNDPRILSAIAQLHPAWVNVFMGWNGIELSKGVYNQPLIDAYRQEFAALPPGTKINVNVAGTPAWAAGGSTDTREPPTSTQDYADFMRYITGRFAGVVTSWEIWNEEDSTGWWLGDEATYVQLLKQAYPAVKAGSGGAQVVFGGTVGNDYDYLSQAYGLGAGGSFDAVGVHTDTGCGVNSPFFYQRDPNSRIDRFSFLGYREVHATMAAHGDGGKPIYMTELGWSTTTGACATANKAGGVTPAQQASFLGQAYHCLALDPYVAVGIWFQLIDNGTAETSLNRFGLLDSNFTPRPAFDALASFSLGGDQLTGGCGNFTAPVIKVATPVENASAPGALAIDVSASAPAGVRRISLYYDGTHLIRNFTDATAPATLHGSLEWQGAKKLSAGPHTLDITALDPQGNTSSTTVHFTHGAAASTTPVLGVAVGAAVVSGKVFVLLPGTGGHISAVGGAKGVGFVPLTTPRTLPVGTIVDASQGVMRLKSATSTRGRTQTGDFGSGVFKILQNRRQKGLTTLSLLISAATIKGCTQARTAAAKKLPSKVLDLLRSTAKGRFQTRGRYSSATVRGTTWTTTERCDGTLTRVTRGVVLVTDTRHHKQILLRAGKSYLAKAP